MWTHILNVWQRHQCLKYLWWWKWWNKSVYICVCVCVYIYIYIYTHTHTHTHTQGVSWLVDITAGGDFLGLCDQKSSYKHVSNFGRLGSYGHFLIPVHAPRVNHSTKPAGGWCTQLGGFIVRVASVIYHLTRLRSYRQSSSHITTLGRYLRNAGKAGWVDIRLASVYCMTPLLLGVQKPLSLTLQWLCQHLMYRTVWR